MPRALPSSEIVRPHASRAGETNPIPAASKERREARKGAALARRLKAAADRHDAGQVGEDVTDLSSEDFIARLRR
ncbi:hypothetical protein [Methylobacterium sp. ap11]|jgi:hypothetical protein|uniref:hypothetical protein n=1 Tax=Methylobacterium sp. ap11 TaxID=1761799 RepID=UPI000A555068|nr:hypothetical protein [Methylobacterium sp. ap11]